MGIFGLASVNSFAMSGSGEAIFNNKCSMCHIKTRPQDMKSLVAPPLMGVMRHVKMEYPNKKDAVAFMVDYVQNPSKAKAVCMPQKIVRFGLMPSQKGNISVEELQTVSSWMFDNFPPKNFRGRMEKRKGMGLNTKQNSMFDVIDTNNDGVISRDEFQRFQQQKFKRLH